MCITISKPISPQFETLRNTTERNDICTVDIIGNAFIQHGIRVPCMHVRVYMHSYNTGNMQLLVSNDL